MEDDIYEISSSTAAPRGHTSNKHPLLPKPRPLGLGAGMAGSAVTSDGGVTAVVEPGLDVIPSGRDEGDLACLALHDLQQLILKRKGKKVRKLLRKGQGRIAEEMNEKSGLARLGGICIYKLTSLSLLPFNASKSSVRSATC
jgi:hypothetical protein